MTTPEQQSTIIDQIDTRQNELLNELDSLNGKVEEVLKFWTSESRDKALPAPEQPLVNNPG
jgi:ElaB/YqjD/DUF883 family membrane-anchored ribosome-binding protein